MSKVIFDMGARHPRSNDKELVFTPLDWPDPNGLTMRALKQVVEGRSKSKRPRVERRTFKRH